MPRDYPTNKQLRVPVVLVIGGTSDLAALVEKAAVGAQVLVTRCALADVTTVAAEIRPLVIVMSDEIFLFDPEAFRALARDVHSRLLTVREQERRVAVIEGALKALMAEAEDFGSEPE
jgi:hypothetical protein